MKNLNLFFLSGIMILAVFFRLHQLEFVPPSASLDEVSIGWNAYSLLLTGKDEFGNSFPMLLRAYDDYRPALYVYFVLPFVKLFDLNIVAVRLPSVLFSIVSVFTTYLLVRTFFKKDLNSFFTSNKIALASAFLLAISPWHIYMSRLGHEVNIGLSLFLVALLFFLKNRIYLSGLFFALSFISYQSEKVFIPLFLLVVFFIFRKKILSMKKKIILASILSMLLILPFIKATLEPNALIRLSGTNVFIANESRFAEQSRKLHEAVVNNDLLGKLFYNRRVISAQLVTESYLSHFNPVWLFTNSSSGSHKIPNLGLLYIWEIPLIITGLYFLTKSQFDKKIKSLIFIWFLISPVSASFTTDSPHALRTLLFLPTWQILSAVGLLYFISIFKNSRIFISIFGVIILLSFLYLYKQYFQVFPKEQSASFQYALSQAMPYIVENEKSYKKIIFANNDALFQSYMFYLFYTKYDPTLYLKQGGTVSGGYSESHKFGKYEFRSVDMSTEQEGNLYIINYSDLTNLDKVTFKIENIFRDLDGKPKIAIISK